MTGNPVLHANQTMKISRCRSRLLSLAAFLPLWLQAAGCPGLAENEKTAWEREFSLGLHMAQGNKETQRTKGQISAALKRDKYQWDLGAEATYGETEETTTTERAKAHAQYDRNLDERLYGSVRTVVEYDAVASLDYRFLFGPALGCYLLKSKPQSLRVEIGPSYIREKEGGETDAFVALRAAERYERKWTKSSRLWQSLEYLPDLRYGNNYLVNAEVGLQANFDENISMKFVVELAYNSQPAEDKKRYDTAIDAFLVFRF